MTKASSDAERHHENLAKVILLNRLSLSEQ